MQKYFHLCIQYLSHSRMPQFAGYTGSVQHTWFSLTATLVLAARQTLMYKHCFFSSPILCSCCIYAISYMAFLTPVESASDLSLQRPGTAVASQTVHYRRPKVVWKSAGKGGGRPGGGSALSILPATTPEALPPGTGRDVLLSCSANVANMPKRKHCGVGWSVPADPASWKGCTEAKEADGGEILS